MFKKSLFLWLIAQLMRVFMSTFVLAMDRGGPSNATAPRIYQPQKLSFPVVSQLNCRTLPDRLLTDCVFPTIQVRERYPQLPPLPFESAIEVRTSRACGLEGPVGFLKVKMRKYGSIPGSETPFLALEDLPLHRTHIRVLKHPTALPLGGIQIYPKSSSIFSRAKFDSNCTITLSVELNEVAIRSEVESAQYLAALQDQLNLLRRSQAFVDLLHSRTQALQAKKGLGQRFAMSEANGEELRKDWEVWMHDLQDDPQHPAHRLTGPLQNFMQEHALLIGQTNRLIQSILDDPALVADVHDNPDRTTLQDYERKIAIAEQEVRAATEFLNVQNLQAIQTRIDERDLMQIGYEEICAPHGLIDEIVESLKRIGKE